MTSTRRTRYRAAAVFGAWTLFGFLLAQQTQLQLHVRGEERPMLSVLAPPMFAAWLWALYTPLVVAATRRLRRVRERGWHGWLACLAGHLALAVALTLIGTRLWTDVRPFIDGTVQPWSVVLSFSLLLDSASYVIVAAMAEAVAYADMYRERDHAAAQLARAAADLEAKLDEARLHALEAQLRPHFLYNTLNVIAELVHDEPEVADAMLTRLGLLLRRAYTGGPHLVPLREELDFVAAYGDILARRFRDRVALTVDVPEALRARAVPVFSLQPLVENAFRHGVERRERGTAVDVSAEEADGVLTVRVRDRGMGPAVAATARAPLAGVPRAVNDGVGDGVGLRNTRERLGALYGARAGLTLERTGADETTATLWLPAGPVAPPAPPAPLVAPRHAAAEATAARTAPSPATAMVPVAPAARRA